MAWSEKPRQIGEKLRQKYLFVVAFLGLTGSVNVAETGQKVTGLKHDTRAQSGNMINKGVNMAVGVLVVGLLTAYLLPIAIDELVSVDTSTWGNAESSLFDLLPLFFVLAIVLFVVAKAMEARS